MIVLDTHIIIWDALNPNKISKEAKEAIIQANESDGIILCDISLWEIAMLMKKERIKVNARYKDFISLIIASNRYIIQEITVDIAELSVNLSSSVNKDPADRIIAATSICNNAPLITADANLLNAKEITTIW
jgi:PIN domain nuclease of toxin-antitoxin system